MSIRSRALGALAQGGRAAGHRSRRLLASRTLSRLPEEARVHLGCGKHLLPDWVNIDLDRSVGPDVVHDFRLGFPAPAGRLRLAYSEHVLEHLSLNDGVRLLRDCRSALAGGGVIRIAMPDLRALVDHYLDDWRAQEWLKDPAYEAIDSPAHMLNHALREWGHVYLYDLPELTLRLRAAGFVDIEPQPWGISPTHPALCDLETRPDSLLIVEATAP